MRATIAAIYRLLLGIQGGYVLSFCVLAAAGMPGALRQGMFVWQIAAATAVSAVIGIFYCVKWLPPRQLRYPKGLPGLFLVGPWHALAPLLFAIVQMSAIIVLGLPEPLSQNIAVLSGLGSFLLSGVLFWLTIALAIWPEPPSDREIPRPDVPPVPRAPVDARALRLTRTASQVHQLPR